MNLMALPTRLTTICRRAGRGRREDQCGHVGANVAGQFQALAVRAHGQRLHRVAQAFAQVEVDAVQLELARLDLGEVEDVVDQPQQGVARFGDDLEEVALLGARAGCPAPVRSCR